MKNRKSSLLCRFCYCTPLYQVSFSYLHVRGQFVPHRYYKGPKSPVLIGLRRLTHKPKVRTAVGSTPTLDSLVTVHNSSLGQPEPCEGNLVAAAGSCGELKVKHPWPLLEISLRLLRASHVKYKYLPTYPTLATYLICQVIKLILTGFVVLQENIKPSVLMYRPCKLGLYF